MLGRKAEDVKRKISESGGPSELKEQMETPEEKGISIMQIAKQARQEEGEKLFHIFKEEEDEVYIASWARWDIQLEGWVELERRCLDLMQEVELLSDRQEVLAGLAVSKRDMQKEAPRKYEEKVFEEFKESKGKRIFGAGNRSIC